MKHNIEFKGFEAKDEVKSLINRLIEKVGRKVRNFSPEEVFLRVAVELNPAHQRYHVSVTLEVPGKTLAAKRETHDLEAALHQVFTEIETQLEDHKASQRGERLWKRLARRRELRASKGQPPPPDAADPQAFFKLVQPHLESLSEFVRSEIDYAEANGDVGRGELEPEDVLDSTLLRAYGQFVKDPARGDIRRWLLQLTLHQIDAEIKRLKQEHQENVPVPADEEDEEILKLYQPNNLLRLERMVPDLLVPSPEEEMETRELRRCVTSTVESLPKLWRRALILRYVKGLTDDELVEEMALPLSEVTRLVEHARAYLRQRLVEAGCSFQRAGAKPPQQSTVSETASKLRAG